VRSGHHCAQPILRRMGVESTVRRRWHSTTPARRSIHLWPRCYVSKLDRPSRSLVFLHSCKASNESPPLADAAEVHPRIGSRLRLGHAFASLQQADCSAQVLPRRLIQRRIGADEIADHIPRGDVQAPSGESPNASETEHCGQNTIRCAPDFCRGLIPTVCANM